MNLLLGRALALSLMFHAYALAYLGTRMPQRSPKPAPVADLSVFLRGRPPPSPPPPMQEIGPPLQPNPSAPLPRPTARLQEKKPVERKTVEKKTVEVRPLYPLEAVARGLEGDVMVRVLLDGDGNVVASQLYQSSGHSLLDEAALHATRTLRGLPDTMAREALLPVRFRLR
jgi:periplasmic protein TonB